MTIVASRALQKVGKVTSEKVGRVLTHAGPEFNQSMYIEKLRESWST